AASPFAGWAGWSAGRPGARPASATPAQRARPNTRRFIGTTSTKRPRPAPAGDDASAAEGHSLPVMIVAGEPPSTPPCCPVRRAARDQTLSAGVLAPTARLARAAPEGVGGAGERRDFGPCATFTSNTPPSPQHSPVPCRSTLKRMANIIRDYPFSRFAF